MMRFGLRSRVEVTAGIFLLGFAPSLQALEHTKVLPKGVRNLTLRSVDTSIGAKTDGSSKPQPLGSPLEKDLTFKKIISGEQPFRGTQVRAFLLANGFSEEQAVGTFSADLKGHLNVFAPIASYGLSDRLTLAAALPIYRAKTSVSVGFRPNATAAAFFAALTDPGNNQTQSAHEAADKLNHAVDRLNNKLAANGYRELEDWQGTGMGDLTLAAKYRMFELSNVAGSMTGGLVAPTGRTDDPDVLNDIAFGDGQWDVFSMLALDQPLGAPGSGFFLNEFGKYTVQLPATRRVRDVTDEEALEVEKTKVRYKLGDKVDAGASVNFQPANGLLSGLGYSYFRKYADLYKGSGDGEGTKSVLAKDSDQFAHNAEAVVGYSSVPAFQRGAVKVPFELKLSYTRQIKSANMPVSHLAQLDAAVYF